MHAQLAERKSQLFRKWMQLDQVILSEVSQAQEDDSRHSYTWGLTSNPSGVYVPDTGRVASDDPLQGEEVSSSTGREEHTALEGRVEDGRLEAERL